MAYTDIDKPSDYFNSKLWTGNGTARNIDVGHDTDLIWIKRRDGTANHRLTDRVRGATNMLSSNNTNATQTHAQTVTGFITNGFSLGTDSGSYDVNTSSQTYVGWSWKANGSGSLNEVGSIDSTVSANTTAGFSIVSYTGTGSAATVGHGLGSAPACYIIKQRDATGGWIVYHKGNTSSPETDYLRLDKTDVTVDDAIFNDTAPTSSVFSIGTNAPVNTSSGTYIAYCFSDVQGYSKFGSYTGNGNADGTFVYTGFKPAWVLIKNTETASNNWVMIDNKRLGYNVDNNRIYADLTNAEDTTDVIDIVSNGFKHRFTGGTSNGSGDNFIYMCFAENPFVTSTGVPGTAR